MRADRLTRINELLRREIGDLLFRVMHEKDFDLSAVTVTHVLTSANLRQARVLISIRNHVAERRRMLAMIEKHRGEIQQLINRHVSLKYTPRLALELDDSLEAGDHVLQILAEIEAPAPERATGGPDEVEVEPDESTPQPE